MGRKSPRFIPAGSTIEITAKVVASRFLLRPSPELNAAILAILGRALSLFPVELHAFAFLSNHWHALLTVADARASKQFIQHVHSTLATAVNRLTGWAGPVFQKASTVIVAPDAEEARLRYVLAQGAKEGLVASPLEWPGAHCARALVGLEELRGVWRDRTYAARLSTPRRGRQPVPAEVRTEYRIELAPLPSWRHLTVEERQARARELVAGIEADAREHHPRPLGVDAICAQDPFARPQEIKRSPAPRIHTFSHETRVAFDAAYISFREQYIEARGMLRAGQLARLPAGCFPPVTPFQSETSIVWAASQPTRSRPDTALGKRGEAFQSADAALGEVGYVAEGLHDRW
jgi:hypothetical protein